MARAYFMDQLLVLLAEEEAKELFFQTGSPPILVSRSGQRCLQGPPINDEEILHLLRSVAGSRHMRELKECGAVQFLLTRPDRSALLVRATMSGDQVVFGIS
jgi:Tfp pilus assembly ATPase PilU